MKSSASELIENGYLNLERLSREFRLWNGFDSDAEPFKPEPLLATIFADRGIKGFTVKGE